MKENDELCVLRVIAAEAESGGFLPFEAAALLLRDGEEVDAISCAVDPGCPPPAWLLRRSGREGTGFGEGSPPERVAEELLRFRGRRPLLVYSGEGPELSLLSESRVPVRREAVLELRHLSWLVLPYLRDHSLSTLASSLLGEELPWRALEEARILGRLLPRLMEAWRETSPGTRSALRGALAEGGNPWHRLLSGPERAPRAAFPDLIEALPRMEILPTRETATPDGEAEGRGSPSALDPELAVELLAEGGPLARLHPAHEPRPQQLAMARAVAEALNDSAFLVVEAGTGVGKSLAYLAPGVLFARAQGSPLIVSTYTRNLQEQLYHRDLPLLSRALGALEYALLKGRNNYLCLRKWSEWCASLSRGDPVLPLHDLTPAEGYAFLAAWMTRTPSGDLEEISIDLRCSLAGTADHLASRTEDCLRSRCPLQGRCFVERARARAWESLVVVVNHALLLSQISAFEGEASDLILPPYRHVVIDEAHHLEDVATQAFTLGFSLDECLRILDEGTGNRGLASLWESHPERGPGEGELTEYRALAGRVRSAAEELFAVCMTSALREGACAPPRAREGELLRLTAEDLSRPTWEEVRSLASELADLLDRFASATARLKDTVKPSSPGAEDRELLLSQRRAEVLADRTRAGCAALRTFFLPPQEKDFPSYLRWVEYPPPSSAGDDLTAAPQIRCAPVSVAESLADLLFRRLDSAVLTSASLRAPGEREGFSFFLRRSGLQMAEESGREVRLMVLDSPFDYRRRSLLLAVKDLPEPASESGLSPLYLEEVCSVCREVIEAVGGRSLVLLTSHQQVGYLHRQLKPVLEREGIVCHRQSRDIPNALLLERFREDRDSVLLATEAFWEGVDVPGESLSAVIMAKLPFRHPGDPVVAGRMEDLERRGGNGWRSYYLPLAVTLFRQGIGRLMRRSTDRGVVVVLDPRFLNRSYASAFRAALPPGMKVRVVRKEQVGEAVREFFRLA